MVFETDLSVEQATEIGADAYLFGFPLVTLEMTRRTMTNAVAPEGMRAPMGRFAHAREFPRATYRDVPAPNADTLYSTAWLDLSAEPYILDIPEAGDRYYMVPLLDGWSEVFQAPGTRTTGNGPQRVAITGPDWDGQIPEGITRYAASTNLVWVVGRVYTTGSEADYAEVHAFQDSITLVPLSEYGNAQSAPEGELDPAVDMVTPVRAQVTAMDAKTYFGLLVELLKHNPPTERDGEIVARMSRVGLVPGQNWDLSALPSAVADGLAQAPAAGLARIKAHEGRAGAIVNGWITTKPTGSYGTNYVHRALLNWQGPGWNLREDAVYPMTRVDAQGEPLDGAKKYVLRFPTSQLPPVNAFWSLSLYDTDGFFFPNPLGRVNIAQHDPLALNSDGSLDLYIQHESPGDANEPNWLPAPRGPFILFLRLYWPKTHQPSILDGSWTPPAVQTTK